MDAHRLTEIIEGAGYVVRPYSGRGMCGKECVSFKDDERETDIIASLIENCDDVEEAADLVRTCRNDQLGRGVVYYWPKCPIQSP